MFVLVQVLQQLEQAKHVPDFNNYLSFIFSKGDNLPLEVRNSNSNSSSSRVIITVDATLTA